MKIFVCAKHVPDTAINISIAGENGYDDSDVRFILNPYDEYALEEAVSLVEKAGGEVVVITIGKATATATIRNALAMGADRAIHVKTDFQFLDSTLTARALKAVIEADGPGDMIFMGKGSVDSEGYQTHYRLASALGLPVLNDVSSLTVEADRVIAQSDVGGGTKLVVEMGLPCIIGATKGLNEPRYPKVMQVMKAKKKEIKEMDLSLLGIDVSHTKTTLKKLVPAKERTGGKIIEGSVDDQVTELIRVLKENEKVL